MKRILIFQHVFREHPSRIQTYANVYGHDITVLRLWEPYIMPDPLDYDALIVLGGPNGVYEDFPSKGDEIAALARAQDKRPILGICLGAQLLAHMLGADVRKHMVNDTHRKEIGHYKIQLTARGKESSFFKDVPEEFKALQWHGDVFEIPSGAEHLARSDEWENQAFSYGKSLGVQFHFEHTPYALAHQIDKFGDWARVGFDFDERKIMDEAHMLNESINELCYTILRNFLEHA